MRFIAKPLKASLKEKIMFGLSWKDILFGVIIFVMFSAIWIPLLLNKEIGAFIGVIIGSIILIILLMLPLGDYRVYSYVFNTIRFVFTKMKNRKFNYVQKIDGNTIYLNDSKKSIYKFYRIIGKDVSLLNENDFLYLSRQLGEFFKEQKNIRLLKIDGKINLNKITKYLNKLRNNEQFKDEIDENIEKLYNLKKNYITSTQPKYFITFDTKVSQELLLEEIKQIKVALNNAELDLVDVTNEEMNDISDRLYFNDITVNEYAKYIECFYNKEYELTKDEMELRDSLEVGNDFVFRNINYYLEAPNKFQYFNDDKQEWLECPHNPFIDLQKTKKYMSFISIKGFPSVVNQAWLKTLFNKKGVDVSFKISTADLKNIDKDLTRVIANTETKLENLANSSAIKFKKMQNELFAYEELASALADGEEIKIINCILKVEGNSPKEITKNIREIVKKLRREGFDFSRLEFNQFDAIKEFFANDTQGVKTNDIECVDNTLGYGFPFTEQELVDEKGLFFGLDQNDTPAFIDWKKMDAFKNSSSMILLGKTGSGKSTTTKRIIKNQIISDEYKVFVIDPENEYGEMIKSYGGESICMNDSKQTINPFDLNLWQDATQDDFSNAVNDKLLFLSTFYRIIFDKKITEDNIEWLLQQTAELYYSTKNKKQITFSDLYRYIQRSNKINVIEQVGYYCSCVNGNKSHIWDNITNIDINNHYICFEFRELLAKSGASALGTAQIFLILQYLNTIVLNNRVENARYINIIIDEAHLLIDPKYIQVVQFVTEMFKRIRKYNGMMTLITQNVTDFYKPEIKSYSTNLINNAFYIIAHTIKAQEVPMLDELMAEQGGLKEAEKEFLTSPACGQCILIYNRARTKIRVNK